jgi:hypothetical protein
MFIMMLLPVRPVNGGGSRRRRRRRRFVEPAVTPAMPVQAGCPR